MEEEEEKTGFSLCLLATAAALTLIIALEVMRKSVARSFTALIFSPLSAGTFRFSSSLSERCRAAPCFAIRSLQVLRSSSLLERVFNVPCSSLLSDCEAGSSSPESSAKGGMEKKWFPWLPPDHTNLPSQRAGDLLPPPATSCLLPWGREVTPSPRRQLKGSRNCNREGVQGA